MDPYMEQRPATRLHCAAPVGTFVKWPRRLRVRAVIDEVGSMALYCISPLSIRYCGILLRESTK